VASVVPQTGEVYVRPGNAKRACARIVLWTILLALLPTSRAQIGFTTGTVFHRWMGFQPAAALAGVDWNTPHISNTLWWSPSVKEYVGNGWTAWEQGAGYLNRGLFGIGPGVLVRYTSNSQYTKTSLYPSFAMQCRTAKWRVEAFVHFRDQWTQNHGRGASLVVRRELMPVHGRFSLAMRAEFTAMKFSDGLSNPYGTVTQAGFVLYHRAQSQ
jgi:hypothetical protein